MAAPFSNTIWSGAKPKASAGPSASSSKRQPCSTVMSYTALMRQVPIRELNQHTADVIARVEAGEEIEITRNGTKVAVITPSSPHPLSALIGTGELRQAPARNETASL